VTIPALGSPAVSQPVSVLVPTWPSITDTTAYFVPGAFSVVIQSSNELPANSIITCTPQTTSIVGASTALEGQPTAAQSDRCIAYNDNATGGPGCDSTQFISVSVGQGRLVQRAYVNLTPAAGVGVSDGSTITMPIAGTPTVNSSPTQVNLGTLVSPLSPTPVTGTLNDITVSDNRGGAYGWSLTADVVDPDGAGPQLEGFNGLAGSQISESALAITPTCAAAGPSNAWDYSAVGQVVLAGFDGTLVAPGQTAGIPAQSLGGGAISLCTKSTATNATTQTTGGVYNVGGTLQLLVPAFQAADKYTAVLQVTLA
jgi:hypothetical protein